MSSTTETNRSPLSKTPLFLALALPSARDLVATPHLVTVALAHAAIAATHYALNAAHPILPLTAHPGGALRELTDAEHFAALILHVSDQLAELLDDYVASYDLEPHDDAPPEAPAIAEPL
jgi:hypothetical protein